MRGKVCIVTGANSGIGKATALGLAERGATVVMLCRDRARGEAARAEIKSRSGRGDVDLLLADLASQASIRGFAEEFRGKYGRLDVLINNAGVYLPRRLVTGDGLEMTFAVNYLAPFLLTNLLREALEAGAPARLVNVAGRYHKRGKIDFDDLQFERDYDAAAANNQAKLAIVLFTYELARRLAGRGVTANCLHPGAVRTNIQRNMPWFPRAMAAVFAPFFMSPEKGARTSLYLASSPEVEGVTGKYFSNMKEAESSPASRDEALARRLWEVGEGLAGLRGGEG